MQKATRTTTTSSRAEKKKKLCMEKMIKKDFNKAKVTLKSILEEQIS